MGWEYLIRSWAFVGPERDDWPGRAAYVAGVEQQEAAAAGPLGIGFGLLVGTVDLLRGEAGDQMRGAYLQWCVDTSRTTLTNTERRASSWCR